MDFDFLFSNSSCYIVYGLIPFKYLFIISFILCVFTGICIFKNYYLKSFSDTIFKNIIKLNVLQKLQNDKI